MSKLYGDNDATQEVMMEILKYKLEPYTDPRELSGCHFHRHEDDTICGVG